MKEKQLRRIKRRQKKKVILLIVILMILAGLVAYSPLFDVKKYEVEGNKYYNDDEILVIGNCKPGGNLFINKNFKEIQARLEKDPYIISSKIKRKLPDTIVLQVKEHIQIAALKYGGKYAIISLDGTVVKTTEYQPQLTIIDGFTISKLEPGEQIETEEKALFRQTMEILSAMEEKDMYFTEIYPSDQNYTAKILNDLSCVGTPESICKSIKEEKLQSVVRKLFDDKITHGTILINGSDAISYSPEIVSN